MSAPKQQQQPSFVELCDKAGVTKRETLHDLREYLPILSQTSTYFKKLLEGME